MNYEIIEFSINELSDAELEPIVELVNLLGEEREPRHVPMTVDEFRVFADTPGQVRVRWAARNGAGDVIALGNTSYSDDGSNPQLLRAQIGVSPGHRHEGIGSALLAKASAQAAALGRSILSGVVFDTAPEGSLFARAIGARETMDFHLNSVRIDDLDTALLRSWLDDGPKRAPGYSLRIVEGQWPEDLHEGMAHLYYVLERDMPTPDSWEPREWTAERVAEIEAHYAHGTESLSAFAIQDEGEALAGMSQLVKRHTDPTTWLVTTTMVDPSHRGRALGKWVKAAVALEALERWPGGEWMDTGNAYTNEAMLGINREMGFRSEYTMTDVEADLKTVQEYLDRRGAGNVE